MATWQFDALLIPRAAASAPSLVTPEVAREGIPGGWSGWTTDMLKVPLRAVGLVRDTWDPQTKIIGQEDGTCVLFTEDDGLIEELRIRIDMRAPDTDFLRAVLAVARRHDLVVVTESGEVLEPEIAWLLRATLHSPAARFVDDPERFLQDLAQDRDDENE